MDSELVKKQAKEILDKFAKALEGMKTEESFVERKEDRRHEGSKKVDISREIMFENSPKKKDDYIKAEKGGWI